MTDMHLDRLAPCSCVPNSGGHVTITRSCQHKLTEAYKEKLSVKKGSLGKESSFPRMPTSQPFEICTEVSEMYKIRKQAVRMNHAKRCKAI